MNESLHNTNADYFKNKVYELTNLNPQEYVSKKNCKFISITVTVSIFSLRFIEDSEFK